MLYRWIGISCVALALAAGCGSPEPPGPDELFKQAIRQWREAAEIIEGITDEATLRDAAGRLDALAQRMGTLNKKASAFQLDANTRRVLEADNRKESEEAVQQFEDAAAKLRDIPGGDQLISRFRRGVSRPF